VLIEVAAPYESRNDGKWYHAPGKFAYTAPDPVAAE
jgi:methylmalonyl-CoA/ethylmalonyl-CoA epimerase